MGGSKDCLHSVLPTLLTLTWTFADTHMARHNSCNRQGLVLLSGGGGWAGAGEDWSRRRD